MNNYFILLLIWNIIVMLIYGLDKLKARKARMRIRESTLLSGAFFLGGIGAMFGMVLFNHKTSKMKFRILVPLFAVTSTILTYLLGKFICS